MTSSNRKAQTPHPLDALTQGAFSAPTAGERASRIRDWLAAQPSQEDLNQVFRELSARDKGAARPIRDKLDELKRARSQDSLATEWAERGLVLLHRERLNIADALAWQRDAAKAGAPLSREPLLPLKAALSQRVQGIEDLQHRILVQREAAMLLAQRIEVLSTKSWRDGQAVHDALNADILQWQTQVDALMEDASWSSIEAKYPPKLEASRSQLLAVWNAFESALTQAAAAAEDSSAALPAVPVWAEEIKVARALAIEVMPRPVSRPKIDPELRARATETVNAVLQTLEAEIAQGHGKASAGAANNLRNALRDHGRLIDERLEHRARSALAAADELEGWQRWRADQLREELVNKAEGLLQRPEGQALGGRKMQETLRALREQWKLADQGGVANHGLWRRFDEACNEAYKVVLAWLERSKAEAAQQRAQRLSLIEELKAWGQDHAQSQDWRALQRDLSQFAERWRDAGHLNEKAFTELQALWAEAFSQAAAGLDQARTQSRERRQAMILEAEALGAAAELRIDAVRELQQRWQAEAKVLPLERRLEQTLWDRFRKPIDDAFQRKTLERERAATQRVAQLSEHDRRVLAASKLIDQAAQEGDARKIRTSMQTLEAALRGEAPAPEPAPASAGDSAATAQDEVRPESGTAAVAEGAVAAAKPVRPVIAVRGDDRPGLKRVEAGSSTGPRGATAGRGGARGNVASGPRRAEATGFGGRGDKRDSARMPESKGEFDRGPRLGDEAFRAQREAMEHAEQTLRKLAAQAHGEAVTTLLQAWEKRDPSALPSLQALGQQVNAGQRSAWAHALAAMPEAGTQEQAADLLLRLEIACQLPTPAEHQEARRAMQLLLLTKRNEAAPAQTWQQDLTRLLARQHEAVSGRRLQAVLKMFLKQ